MNRQAIIEAYYAVMRDAGGIHKISGDQCVRAAADALDMPVDGVRDVIRAHLAGMQG